MEVISKDPPDLVHVGYWDVVFKSWLGPMIFKGQPHQYELLDPEQIVREENKIRKYLESLRNVGVEMIIPYINSVYIFGEHEKRKGFWQFYDNWNKYYSFGLPKKPEKDPIKWTYNRFLSGCRRFIINETCIFEQEWKEYLKFITRHATSLGYNGVFVDVNDTRCNCERCRVLFYQYLCKKYGVHKVGDLFGFTDPETTRLGVRVNGRDEGLLTLETNLFRAEGFASLFKEIREEIGASHIVIPNSWPMSTISALFARRGNGHDPEVWASAVEWVMFEESLRPGIFCSCGQLVYDNILQYKYALAIGIKPVVLNYMAQDEASCKLANFEVLAGGGGAFVQPGIQAYSVVTKLRHFVKRHGELLESLQEKADVALVFLKDQHIRGNLDHLVQVYHIRRYLSDQHYAFSLLVGNHVNAYTLSRFKAIIMPQAKYISMDKVKDLLEYVKQGGLLITTDETGKFDEKGCVASPPADLLQQNLKYGKGRIVNIQFKELIPTRDFELFMLSEKEANDWSVVLAKCKEAHETGLDIPRGSNRLKGLLESASVMPILEQAPLTLRVNIFSMNNLITIHLINYTLPAYANGDFIPVKNLMLQLEVKRPIRKIEALSLEKRFKPYSIYNKGLLKVRVPEIRDYLLLALQTEQHS
jgi:hypothetical protein